MSVPRLSGAVLRRRLEQHFRLDQLGTSLRTEVVAGATTFLAMSYIVAVNPAILADAGIPPVAAAFATCFVSGAGSIAMGLWARLPLAVAPGMGLNAFFAYTVVQGMGLSWQEGLGAVFLAGAAFVLLTLLGVRQALVRLMPRELVPAIGAGIGLFLLMIGMRNAGLIRGQEATLLARGDWSAPETVLAVCCLLLIATLLSRGVRAGILLGIAAGAVAAPLLGLGSPAGASDGRALDAVLELDLRGAFRLGLADIVFSLLFVDFFDSLGTAIGVIRKAGLENAAGRVPRLGRMMGVDAGSTVIAALFGSSTATTYIESAAGVTAGGRSGLTAVVTGALFLAVLPVAPLVAWVPSAAVAAALIVIGATIAGLAREIDWAEIDHSVPAVFTMVGMPLTFSISDGLAMGIVAFSALKILRGRAGETSAPVHLLAVFFVLRYACWG